MPYGPLGLLALVCLVVGALRRGVLPLWLTALSLVAPLAVMLGSIGGPRPFAALVPWIMLAALVLLVLGAVGVQRSWSRAGALTMVGLALPLLLLLPLLGGLYNLFTGGGTLD